MTDPTPKQIVDELLSDMPAALGDRPVRNAVADNEPLAVAVAYALDLIENGTLHISLRRFYEDKLRAQFKGPRAIDTVKTYVKEFLKRDFLTGKAL